MIKKIKSNKKMTIVIISLLVIIGVSLAFVAPIIMDGASNNTDIIADSVDKLNFRVDKEIGLNVTQHNLIENGDNLERTSVGTASLLANNTDNTASYTYYVYFNIKNNEYIYTTEDKKPEIILTVKDPNDQIITEIQGLTYNETLQGFDITTKTGLIKVADKYAISSNSSTTPTEQNWTFTVSFINLETNQKDNSDKTMYAEIILQEKPLFVDYIKSTFVSNEVGQTLLHHDSTLANGANDNSYRYSGGDYKIASAHSSEYETVYDTSIDTDVGIIKFYCGNNEDNSYIGIENYCRASSNYDRYYYLAYDANVTQYSSRHEAAQQAILDGYLEYGANNYVCFGTNDEICLDDNLYRIIGVFGDTIKLIKYDYVTNELGTNGDFREIGGAGWPAYRGNKERIGYFYWNARIENGGTQTSIWSESRLNTINLNTNYINYIGDEWAKKITMSTWEIADAKYGISETTYNAKIGLMYRSDYSFAINLDFVGSYETTNMIENNWMYMGLDEWTISRSEGNNAVYGFSWQGHVTYCAIDYVLYFTVRPAFYLSTSVSLKSGTGTYSDPYRI